MLSHINIELQNIRDENIRNLNVYQNLSLQKTSFRILGRIVHTTQHRPSLITRRHSPWDNISPTIARIIHSAS